VTSPFIIAVSWILAAAPPPPQRFAVVVGANAAAPGREKLRFAHRDAQEMAEVLARTGEFPLAQVTLLLDPAPEVVLAALDAALSHASSAREGALVLFYYSGHSDTEVLFPGGQPLALAALRDRLESAAATVRVGILDACRGGGWTQAKGFTREAPLDIRSPLELRSEGSALLASSSGLESAHESEMLAGSFFTHHLVAGLRGAADRNADGEVTLAEAFAYAKELTIRDSSLQAEGPQHPSYQLNMRGRSDLPVARVNASDTVVELRQSEGPLQVIQLTTGLVILELPHGNRAVRVAVSPGRYLVRSKGPDGVRAREIALEANHSLAVAEENLELVGTPQLAAKYTPSLHAQETTLPAGNVQLSIAVGQGSIAESLPRYPRAPGFLYRDNEWIVPVSLTIGLTDRLEWALPLGLSYRLGDRRTVEVIPSLGFTHVGYSSEDNRVSYFGDGRTVRGSPWFYGLGAGIGLRKWLAARAAVNFVAQAFSAGTAGGGENVKADRWAALLAAGYSRTFAEVLTLNLGFQVVTPAVSFGASAPPTQFGVGPTQNGAWGFGSVRWTGSRSLPLVQLHLRGGFSLDFDTVLLWEFSTGNLRGRVVGGATLVF
jgi:hypothetical protein